MWPLTGTCTWVASFCDLDYTGTASNIFCDPATCEWTSATGCCLSCAPRSFPLLIEANLNSAGTVDVWNDAHTLYVKYKLDVSLTNTISQLSLHLESEATSGFLVGGRHYNLTWGRPPVANYEYQHKPLNNEERSTYEFQVPRASVPSSTIRILAYANLVVGGESQAAFGGHLSFYKGRNPNKYYHFAKYTLCDPTCETESPPDPQPDLYG